MVKKEKIIIVVLIAIIIVLLSSIIWVGFLSPVKYDGGNFKVQLPHGSNVTVTDDEFTMFYNSNGGKLGHIGLMGISESGFNMVYNYLGVNSEFTKGFLDEFEESGMENFTYSKTVFSNYPAVLIHGISDGSIVSYYAVNCNGRVFAVIINESCTGYELLNETLTIY